MPDDLRYPIGSFHFSGPNSDTTRARCIDRIATLPDRLESVLATLSPHDWETPYRSGGWTVRQVVQHLPDSHLHAYTRFLFALAEDGTTICPYDEVRWSEVVSQRDVPPELSVTLLRALHDVWVALLRTLSGDDFQRTVHHPGHGRALSVDELLGMYAWHGDHHLAHIESVARRSE